MIPRRNEPLVAVAAVPSRARRGQQAVSAGAAGIQGRSARRPGRISEE